MFRKLITSSCVLILLVIAGCTSPSSGSPTNLPIGYGNAPPEDATWISPAKVIVLNFYPGGIAEYNLTIHNGSLTATEFAISYRYPDHVGDGYAKPPAAVQGWIMIVDPSIVLQGRATQDVLIVLDMPKDATIEFKKWEFWISVMEANQPGLVQTEMATRWLVTMK